MLRSFVSPPRYVQQSGALSQLGEQVQRVGDRVLFVSDEVVWGVVGETVEQSLAAAGCEYSLATFRGECTPEEVERLADRARAVDADVVVGAGGGKALDAAKAVRAAAADGLVTVPTVASTDAPASGLSVLYDATGAVEGGMVHEGHPDLVLVDTAVVAAAPTRWFVSGIGDALATHFEAQATAASGGRTIAGGRPTEAGGALAERCHDVVRANALPAVRAVREDRVTDAVEKTTEAVVLLSGLGFENGGLAAAHAIHDAISARVQSDATHGEKVCVGLLGQLHLEDRPETEIREVTRFARDVGLPVTLTAVGVSDADVDDVARAAFHEESTVGNQPSDPEPSDVARALRAVERLGRSME